MYEEKLSIIDQRQVRLDTKDFKTAVISMFREDVDVGLIGEMRDQETISSAVTAAETGHLIFSTLHTNNAAQSIDRIIDIFPPGQQEQIRLQLASSLTGIFPSASFRESRAVSFPRLNSLSRTAPSPILSAKRGRMKLTRLLRRDLSRV